MQKNENDVKKINHSINLLHHKICIKTLLSPFKFFS